MEGADEVLFAADTEEEFFISEGEMDSITKYVLEQEEENEHRLDNLLKACEGAVYEYDQRRSELEKSPYYELRSRMEYEIKSLKERVDKLEGVCFMLLAEKKLN